MEECYDGGQGGVSAAYWECLTDSVLFSSTHCSSSSYCCSSSSQAARTARRYSVGILLCCAALLTGMIADRREVAKRMELYTLRHW